jgi:hypothetical protein
LSWQDRQGAVRFLPARGLDLSRSGARIETDEPLEVGSCVFARVMEYGLGATASVRHCTRRGAKYVIGLELGGTRVETNGDGAPEDYYELLQISPAAEMETIHRVYRILVSRYHPDNPHTGNAERFLRLSEAYATLSDPEKRAAYDRNREPAPVRPLPVFEMKEFLGGIDAEANRRLGILCLLYHRRRINADQPGLSLLDFETLMAIPREHLLFSVWFLKEKRYIRTDGNFEFEITADGVEYVESSLPARSIVHKLLRAPQDETPDRPAGQGPGL